MYEFRDVSFYDADLSFLDLTLLKFKQGETTFQKMVGMRRANVEYSYSMHNAKFEENILDYGKLEMNADNGLLSVNINAEAEKYGASVSVVADVSNQNPIFKSHIVLQNITDFTMLHKNIIEFFDKKYIFFSTLDKFHGHVNITLRNSVVFGETVPYVFLRGKMQNGVTEFGEQKFASGGEFAGKISGKIDMTKHTPLFTISSSFVNLKTEEFQKILPIDTKFTGTISGGGGLVFAGLSYTEFLNSLQMKAKFVLQKIKLPQLNLNFLAQHLLKTHGNNLFTFDKLYER